MKDIITELRDRGMDPEILHRYNPIIRNIGDRLPCEATPVYATLQDGGFSCQSDYTSYVNGFTFRVGSDTFEWQDDESNVTPGNYWVDRSGSPNDATCAQRMIDAINAVPNAAYEARLENTIEVLVNNLSTAILNVWSSDGGSDLEILDGPGSSSGGGDYDIPASTPCNISGVPANAIRFDSDFIYFTHEDIGDWNTTGISKIALSIIPDP